VTRVLEWALKLVSAFGEDLLSPNSSNFMRETSQRQKKKVSKIISSDYLAE